MAYEQEQAQEHTHEYSPLIMVDKYDPIEPSVTNIYLKDCECFIQMLDPCVLVDNNTGDHFKLLAFKLRPEKLAYTIVAAVYYDNQIWLSGPNIINTFTNIIAYSTTEIKMLQKNMLMLSNPYGILYTLCNDAKFYNYLNEALVTYLQEHLYLFNTDGPNDYLIK